MNFFSYLAYRFSNTVVGEVILGLLALILVVVLSPILLVSGTISWVIGVYREWESFEEEKK